MESVSYGNYLYYNAESISEAGLRNNGIVYFNESNQKTLGTQNVENFSRLFVFPDITSLKMAGSRMFATRMELFGTSIQSVDLATNASSISPPPTADIRDLDNSSSIGNTLYFLSLPRAPGSSFRRLWRSDGTAAGTSTIDTENTSYTGTYAWNGGLFYAKNNGGGGGGFYRYNPTTNAASTISTGGVFVSEFTEFASSLYLKTSTGSGFGALKKTDGTTISTVAVATYGYEDVQIKLVGNRMVVAVKSIATGNWNIRSSTDGTNFTEHFTSIANLTLIGGANGILLGAVGTSSRNLVQYNLSNNTSSVMGTGAFYNLNPSPAIDDTNPAAPIFYLAMAPTSTSGYFLYKTTLTTSGASALMAIGSAWVRVINRKSNPWQTLHRVGKKIFFLGQDADKSRGIEMWVYNPDRCTNALTLASYDEDRYNSELNTEESKREIHYLSNTTITATNKITNATVLYRAGQSVTFLPGFQAGLSPADMYAPAGKGSFEAQIGGCGTLVPR